MESTYDVVVVGSGFGGGVTVCRMAEQGLRGYGPSMTSRIDYSDERGFMVADGGLPGNFGGLLAIVREVNASPAGDASCCT